MNLIDGVRRQAIVYRLDDDQMVALLAAIVYAKGSVAAYDAVPIALDLYHLSREAAQGIPEK